VNAPIEDRARHRSTRVLVLVVLAASIAASTMFVVGYWKHWSTRALGVSFGAALLALGIALEVIALRVLPRVVYVEKRESLAMPDEQLALELDLARSGEYSRRRFIWLALGSAFGAFALAALAPLRSLGVNPDGQLTHTPWRAGTRVVDAAGRQVHIADVPVGGALTVFPAGAPDSPNGQAMLVRVDDATARSAKVPPTIAGIYVYSRLCTHMGCPVGQYLVQRNELMCPCHQSTFDVLDAGRPKFGPAGRALPSLPIAVDTNGGLVARGDFSGPVGPSYWNLP